MNDDLPDDNLQEPVSEQVKHQAVTARVPEGVSAGVFATGASILQARDAFVVDFLSAMTPPVRVCARVVMSPDTFYQFILALEENYGKYAARFLPRHNAENQPPDTPPDSTGSAQKEPAAIAAADGGGGSEDAADKSASEDQSQQPARKGTQASDLYEQIKLPDEMLGGAYANSVMIRHDAHEFGIDFIANFYPRPAVTTRVYLAAGRMEVLVRTIRNSWVTFQRNSGGQSPGHPPGPEE